MSLRENLSRNAAKALGGRKATPVESGSTIAQAITAMRERSTGCAIVTDRGAPIGVLTERDILARVLAKGLSTGTCVDDIMTKNPCEVREGDAVGNVIHTMHAGGFRNMPVVDGSGILTGVVSIRRVVEFIVEHIPEAVFNLPPEPQSGQAAREGA